MGKAQEIDCVVMERVTPVTDIIFKEIPFAGSLANTMLGRFPYDASLDEQQEYVDKIAMNLNEIRNCIAESVHEFNMLNQSKKWVDFKLDNVGKDGNEKVVLLDEESGVVNSSDVQVIRNIEDWGINGQYSVFNTLRLNAENQKKLK